MAACCEKWLKFDMRADENNRQWYANSSGTRSLDFARDDVVAFSAGVTEASWLPGYFFTSSGMTRAMSRWSTDFLADQNPRIYKRVRSALCSRARAESAFPGSDCPKSISERLF